jgi:two-component sensor histidine kinase
MRPNTGLYRAARAASRVNWAETTPPDGNRIFTLQWIESGGPEVKPPRCRGFGVRAIERMLESAIEGQVHLDFAAEGVRCVVHAPLTESLDKRR